MLKLEELKELIGLIDESSISEFVYEVGEAAVSIKKASEVVQVSGVHAVTQQVVSPTVEGAAPVVTETVTEQTSAAVEQLADANIVEINSPMVGTFYAKPSPENDAYVQIGQNVSESSIVCIVEAMKLFNEIEAGVNGEIVEVLVNDGELVEFGQALFKVKTK